MERPGHSINGHHLSTRYNRSRRWFCRLRAKFWLHGLRFGIASSFHPWGEQKKLHFRTLQTMRCVYIIANAIITTKTLRHDCQIVRCNHVQNSTRELFGGRTDYHLFYNNINLQGYSGTHHNKTSFRSSKNKTCLFLGPDLRAKYVVNDAWTLRRYKKSCKTTIRLGTSNRHTGKLHMNYTWFPSIDFSPSCGFVAAHYMRFIAPNAFVYLLGFTFYDGKEQWLHDFAWERTRTLTLPRTSVVP